MYAYNDKDIVTQLENSFPKHLSFVAINQEKELLLLVNNENVYETFNYVFKDTGLNSCSLLAANTTLIKLIKNDFPNVSLNENALSLFEFVSQKFRESSKNLNQVHHDLLHFDFNLDRILQDIKNHTSETATPINIRDLNVGDVVYRSIYNENHDGEFTTYTKDTVSRIINDSGWKQSYYEVRFEKASDVFVRNDDLNDNGNTVFFSTAKELLAYIEITDLQ
jgi:hypothetical protein